MRPPPATAIEAAICREIPTLQRYARKLTRNDDPAADLVQDTLAQVVSLGVV